MRLQKEIAKLDATRGDVKFPEKPDGSFERFRAQLRKVVEENLGPGAAGTLDWDDYNQEFYFKLEGHVRVAGIQGSHEVMFYLDVKKGVGAEIERLQREISAYVQECRNLTRADEKQRAIEALQKAEVR